MSYIPLEKVIDKVDYNMYKLVVLASRRAIELEEGLPSLISVDSQMKKTSVALLEIAEGKVGIKKIPQP